MTRGSEFPNTDAQTARHGTRRCAALAAGALLTLAAGSAHADESEVVPSAHAKTSLLPAESVSASTAFGMESRTIDGSGNNVANPSWGSAGIQLLRISSVGYDDGISTPAGGSRPGSRELSNAICDQDVSVPSPLRASDFVWQWGQFLDHDIDLAEIADPEEQFDIAVPSGDAFFDPTGTGTVVIELNRAAWDPATGTDASNPRQQLNFITSFIDASNVYGSDPVRADALRTNDGTGKLATSAGDYPPYNTGGLPNAGGTSSSLFLAGDVRANEQIALTAMHTLFVREHNRLCDEMAAADPTLTGEDLYQQARAIVGAQMQVITVREFLPALFGSDPLGPYPGYDPALNPGISNVFATAAYRLGHSMLPDQLLRLDSNFKENIPGNILLKEVFFAPFHLVNDGGVEPLFRGLAFRTMQRIDGLVIDAVRNFLFRFPDGDGFDLAALNIQRGRDHGLPHYNQTRIDFGLAPVTSFAEITSDPALQSTLATLYGSVNDIDLWIGGLCEDPLPNTLVGELYTTVLLDQFNRLREGDRFWYENVFSGQMLADLEATRLSHIIRRNTTITHDIQIDVFQSQEVADLPAASQWGTLALALSLLAAGALLLGSRRTGR